MICPICTFHGEPGPVTASGARESMLCPWCGCSSRHRAIVTELETDFDHPRDAVYQVGWDPLTPFIGARCVATGAQFMVSEMENRLGCVRVDLEDSRQLPEDEQGFEIIICSDVLEHVRLYRLALANLASELRIGGKLILTVPGAPTPGEHYEFCHIADPLEPVLDVWDADTPVHEDPLDVKGCRVYRTYGREKLAAELEELGLRAEWRDRFDPECAIVNCAVLVGVKVR